MKVLTILSPEKYFHKYTLAYNFMDFTDIFKPMDNNSRIKGNPSIWSTAQLSLLVIREMLGCFLGCELVLIYRRVPHTSVCCSGGLQNTHLRSL